MWNSYQYHFIWDVFILFVTSTFLIYGHKFPLLSYSGCLPKVSQIMAVSSFPRLDFSSIIHLCLMWTSLPVLSLFISMTYIHLWSIHFVKCHGFITGRHRVNTMICFAVCAWTCNTWSVTYHQQTLKEVKWLVTDQDAYLLLM